MSFLYHGVLQANVSDVAGEFYRRRAGRSLRRSTGRRPGRHQALPLRLSPVCLARRRQSRPAAAGSLVSPSRLAVYWRPAAEADRLLRETQTHQ